MKMKADGANAIYGILDYLAYPVGMLLAAPFALRALGAGQYGIWMMAVSAVSTGAIIASGFGDANIRYVAMHRAKGSDEQLLRAVRGTMGIHLLLGSAMAVLGWLLAPAATQRIVASIPSLYPECLWSLRIAALLMLVRAVESVCVSTQRAFQRYGEAVRISVIARLLCLLSAAVLPFVTHRATSVLIATALLSAVSVVLQLLRLGTLLNTSNLLPAFNRDATKDLMHFGVFSWIQSVSGLLFGQVDRLVVGVALGAVAVSSYALCVQLAQPIYGLAASGLHFLFPRVAAEQALGNRRAIRSSVVLAFLSNLILVAAGTAFLLIFGKPILHLWGGEPMSRAGGIVLVPIVWSTALSGLAVSGCYSMLALGRAGLVTTLTLIGGAAMSLSMPWLLHHHGIFGVACSRLFFGPVTLVIYLPLMQVLRRDKVRGSKDFEFADTYEKAG